MSNNHRLMVGTVGMAAAGLLGAPLIALLASPCANADPSDAGSVIVNPVTTYGPYTLDGYTDTLSFNPTTDGFDNYLTGAFGGINFDLDLYSPAANTYDAVLTDPGVFQFDVVDTAGVLSYTDSLIPADFVSPDIGLGLL